MNKFIFTFFAFLLVVSFGCSSKETAKTTTNSAANAPANTAVVEKEPEIDITAPFTPSANPKDDLLNSTKRLQGAESWTATLQSNLYPEAKTELKYLKPDRYHIKNSKSEVILIGKDGYGNQGGKWEKIEEDFGALIEQMKKNFNAESMKSINEVKKTGTEKIGNREATIYEYSIAGNNVMQNTTKVWIASDGLPLRTVVETQQPDATQRVTTEYSYDKPVKIEAPQIQ